MGNKPTCADTHQTSTIALTPVAKGKEYAGRCLCGWMGQAQRSYNAAVQDADDHRNAVRDDG